MKTAVVVERWVNAETFAAAEVPKFVIVRFDVNDDGAFDGYHSSGIKVERSVVVLPGRHFGVNGGLSQDIRGEFGMRK